LCSDSKSGKPVIVRGFCEKSGQDGRSDLHDFEWLPIDQGVKRCRDQGRSHNAARRALPGLKVARFASCKVAPAALQRVKNICDPR